MATTLTKRSPLMGVAGFRDFFDPLFNDIEAQLGMDRPWSPAIDVVRGDDSVTIHADVPGIKADDIKIEVENDVLTISGKMEEVSEEERDDYIRRERRAGMFSRSIALPPNTDRSSIDAVVKDGVCSVTIPMPTKGEAKVEIKPKAG